MQDRPPQMIVEAGFLCHLLSGFFRGDYTR